MLLMSFDQENRDISEPVISFIKCFKNNPKRFKKSKVVSASAKRGWNYLCWSVCLRDMLTKVLFKVIFTSSSTAEIVLLTVYSYNGGTEIDLKLTLDELSLLSEEIAPYYRNKMHTLNELRSKRKKDFYNKIAKCERNRLTDVYGGNNV